MFCIQLRGACTTASGISPSPWWDSRDPVLLLSTLPSLVDLHITECPLGLLQGSEFNLCRQYEEKVRPCIDLIDSLRALGVERDLALPAIAVIGDQSSGKSSVLEALSGVALPRGSGENSFLTIVLGHLVAPRAVLFSPQSGAQNLIAGTGLGISDELISLEVSSPSVPDLTLIDLPGITRVAVGNQPTDIGRQIKRLIRKYIQKQETINLVVVPSNVDIATTEALSMAQEVDPDGDRTIAASVWAQILSRDLAMLPSTSSKIEDIRLEQEQGAERWIRLHFQMEQIVYCQDQVYRGALQGVREKEAEEEKRKSYGQSQSVSAEESSMAEIFQHLDAYRKEAHNRISSLLPLIIQFFVLKTFGQKLQTAMLMLLQDKDACGWLLKERSDTSDKRKFLKERLSRLTQARHRLAKFPG
uniref:MX dynamin like GTPase 1 n=1 Tax=Spermophilus dauricus TaxID=99837 RepID=A0A8C9QPR3_SPEDA